MSKLIKYSALWLLVLVCSVLPVLSSAQEFRVIPEPDSAEVNPAKGKGERAKKSYTNEDISKAFMNCLIDVDNTLAVLAKKAEAKVVQSESVSQRGFCENRRKDCNKDSRSPDCQIFMEEFLKVKVL